MANKNKQVAQIKAQERQNGLVDRLKQKEQWMKWAIIAGIVIILLLLLLLGYATDWTRGLRKDETATATPLSTSLDSATAGDAGAADRSGTNSSDASKASESSSDRSSTSTTNTTTNTTTNNSTTTPGSAPPAGLLDLYSNSNAGDDIQALIDRANQLGIDVNCSEDVLVQTCMFTQDGQTITTKNLRLNGMVTSVLNNFNQN